MMMFSYLGYAWEIKKKFKLPDAGIPYRGIGYSD